MGNIQLQSDSDKLFIRRVNEIYHDLQANVFNKVHAKRHRVERVFWVRKALPLINQHQGHGIIIDLCSGTGFLPSVLMPGLNSRFSMECVDVSAKALDFTKNKLLSYKNRLSFQVASAENLPYDDESIDCITLNAGLHHVPGWGLCLTEINRVLKPGGLFCLGHEPNKFFFNTPLLIRMERVIWHIFWYASFAQNKRRINKLLGRCNKTSYELNEHLTEINKVLMDEGFLDKPMTTRELRKFVDPHTHESEDEVKSGFDSHRVTEEYFPGYHVETLCFSDYGGDMLRKFPLIRRSFDTIMSSLFKKKGRLFSMVIRKNNEAKK